MRDKEKLTIGRGGILTYSYTGGGWSFQFHMLCEVGEWHKPWFIEEIRTRGLNVETRLLAERPWVADFVVKARRQ
jgi:hypothetical protein